MSSTPLGASKGLGDTVTTSPFREVRYSRCCLRGCGSLIEYSSDQTTDSPSPVIAMVTAFHYRVDRTNVQMVVAPPRETCDQPIYLKSRSRGAAPAGPGGGDRVGLILMSHLPAKSRRPSACISSFRLSSRRSSVRTITDSWAIHGFCTVIACWSIHGQSLNKHAAGGIAGGEAKRDDGRRAVGREGASG